MIWQGVKDANCYFGSIEPSSLAAIRDTNLRMNRKRSAASEVASLCSTWRLGKSQNREHGYFAASANDLRDRFALGQELGVERPSVATPTLSRPSAARAAAGLTAADLLRVSIKGPVATTGVGLGRAGGCCGGALVSSVGSRLGRIGRRRHLAYHRRMNGGVAWLLELRLRARGNAEYRAIIDRCLSLVTCTAATSDPHELRATAAEVRRLEDDLGLRFGAPRTAVVQ
jgi:hypothetical protein